MSSRTFFGVPVTGEIQQGSTRVEQEPIENMQPLFEAVLNYPTIVEFGWTQYTPYFNDGEPCEFSVGCLWVRTAENKALEDAGVEDYDHYDLEVGYGNNPSLGSRGLKWDGEKRKYVSQPYVGPDEERWERCEALDRAIQSGKFENALLEAFGDHASVTVSKSGIEVEFYSHD